MTTNLLEPYAKAVYFPEASGDETETHVLPPSEDFAKFVPGEQIARNIPFPYFTFVQLLLLKRLTDV
jgi:hypothetical protein